MSTTQELQTLASAQKYPYLSGKERNPEYIARSSVLNIPAVEERVQKKEAEIVTIQRQLCKLRNAFEIQRRVKNSEACDYIDAEIGSLMGELYMQEEELQDLVLCIKKEKVRILYEKYAFTHLPDNIWVRCSQDSLVDTCNTHHLKSLNIPTNIPLHALEEFGLIRFNHDQIMVFSDLFVKSHRVNTRY